MEDNKAKKTIAILFGGSSKEHEVSLKSAYSVIGSIDRELYEPVLVGITRQGEWFLYEGDIDHIPNGSWEEKGPCTKAVISPDRTLRGLIIEGKSGCRKVKLDGAFPVLHGRGGEDGTVQGILELAGIPVVGCGLLSSALCMDKAIAHLLVAAAGVKVPECVTVNRHGWNEESVEKVNRLRYPLFVKPVNEGSSLGISKIEKSDELEAAAERAFEYDPWITIEEAIPGFEVGCAVLGEKDLIIGQVDEIELHVEEANWFFDFHEKYTQKKSHIYMPARIDDETVSRIQETAVKIYRALRCDGFARVDMFLTPEKEIYFNEVNTIPGLTTLSRFPKMLAGSGFAYDQVINKLIGDTLCASTE